MARVVFADTCYWIAVLNQNDDLHEKALSVSKTLARFKTVTTEMVLAELMNHFGERGQALRHAASRLLSTLREDPNVEIVPQTSVQFRRAAALYAERPDKAWSLTDCASIVLMRERGMVDALTNDCHFTQAQLSALLREDG